MKSDYDKQNDNTNKMTYSTKFDLKKDASSIDKNSDFVKAFDPV